MAELPCTDAAFLCILEVGGSLWLQGERELADATVARSDQLLAIHETVRQGDLNTKFFISDVDVCTFNAWLSAVAADDKVLEHLSAQQLAKTLTVADFLRDTALLKEVAAAQRPRILAIKPQPPGESSPVDKARAESPASDLLPPACAPSCSADSAAPDASTGATAHATATTASATGDDSCQALHPPHACGPDPVFFSANGVGPLRWFEQLAAELSEAVLWALLREAVGFPKHIGDGTTNDWLLELPSRLMAFAARACSPCIDTRGAFHARITDDHSAQRVSVLVRELRGQLREVFLMLPCLPTDSRPGEGLEQLLASVCAVPELRTLRVCLPEGGVDRVAVNCLAHTLRPASSLESLAVEVMRRGPSDLVVDTTARQPGDAMSDADGEDALERDLADLLAALPQLQSLRLVGLRGLEALVGHALQRAAGTLRALRQLHVVDCTFHSQMPGIMRAMTVLPQLKCVHLSPTPAPPTEAAVRRRCDETGITSPRVFKSSRERWTYQRSAAPDETSGAERSPDRSTEHSADATACAPVSGKWEQVEVRFATDSIEPALARTLEKGLHHTLRSFHLDGAAWTGYTGQPMETWYGLRVPTTATAARVLAPQSHLTELFLGGDVQPNDDLSGDALAGVVAGLPLLRVLSLRATGMPRATADLIETFEWDDLPEDERESFPSWVAPMVKLVQARAGHAVPLERLSLDLLHPFGRAAALMPEAAAVLYTAEVASVVTAVAALPALTSLDISVVSEAIVPGQLLEALAASLSSLRQLRMLRLSIVWSSGAVGATDGFMHSLRHLSQLTELQLRLRSRKGAAMSVNTLAKVALGLEGAMAARGGEGSASGRDDGSPASLGMTELQLLRLGPVAKGFESAVEQVERAGRHWKAAKGSSRLLGGMCVPVQHAEWLEVVGELQRVAGGAGDGLYIVLG